MNSAEHLSLPFADPVLFQAISMDTFSTHEVWFLEPLTDAGQRQWLAEQTAHLFSDLEQPATYNEPRFVQAYRLLPHNIAGTQIAIEASAMSKHLDFPGRARAPSLSSSDISAPGLVFHSYTFGQYSGGRVVMRTSKLMCPARNGLLLLPARHHARD